MNTSIKQRLQGTLVAMVVALTAFAVGAAPASAAQAAGNADSATAGISALTKAQKKAKAKALKKCKKIKKAKKRKACIKKVNKKYKKKPAPKGKTYRVEVLDDYYSPGDLTIKANDWLLWDWKGVAGSEPHNVSLGSAPAGVNPRGFESNLTSSTTYTFKRQLTKPGDYTFFCSLHTLMTMNVKVTK